ncbi:MAG: TolC family protein [Bryobacteraceae bacterium]|nr:TolC family protein [Bryobacteraceae bacterium]
MTSCLRFLALAVCTALSVQPSPAQEWTEEQVVRRFLDQSPWVRDARARTAVAAAEARSRTLYSNPRVRYVREGAGLTEFLQAEQTIHWSGRLGLLRKSGVVSAGVAEAEGALDLWEARTSLRLAFYQALAGQELGAVYEDGLKEIDEVNRVLAEREAAGEIARFDRLRAERERAQLVAEWALVQAETELDLGRLRGFLPADVQIARVSGRLETSLSGGLDAETLARRAMAARQDFRAEQQRLTFFQLEQRAAERLRIPEPVVSAGYKRADIGMNQIVHGGVVELSVPLPLFNKGQAEVSRFSAEQERSSARLQILSRQIRAAVDGTVRAFNARREAKDRFSRALSDSGPELVRIATVAYLEGEIGILQLLDAYRSQREAQMRMLEIELAVKEAQIELERVVGEELDQ